MRKGLLAAVAVAAAVLTGCTTGASAVDVDNGGQFRFVEGTRAGQVIPADERRTAPTFSGALLDGSAFSSSSLSGKVAVLNFWGSWCPPCRVETPEFQQVYDEVKDSGVQFLGLDVKENDVQFAQAFVDTEGITYPSLFDPKGEVALAFRGYPATAIPSTIVLDARNRVAAVYTGAVKQDDLRQVVDRVLKES